MKELNIIYYISINSMYFNVKNTIFFYRMFCIRGSHAPRVHTDFLYSSVTNIFTILKYNENRSKHYLFFLIQFLLDIRYTPRCWISHYETVKH